MFKSTDLCGACALHGFSRQVLLARSPWFAGQHLLVAGLCLENGGGCQRCVSMATKRVKSREQLCSGILRAVSVPSLTGRPNRAVLGSPAGTNTKARHCVSLRHRHKGGVA